MCIVRIVTEIHHHRHLAHTLGRQGEHEAFACPAAAQLRARLAHKAQRTFTAKHSFAPVPSARPPNQTRDRLGLLPRRRSGVFRRSGIDGRERFEAGRQGGAAFGLPSRAPAGTSWIRGAHGAGTVDRGLRRAELYNVHVSSPCCSWCCCVCPPPRRLRTRRCCPLVGLLVHDKTLLTAQVAQPSTRLCLSSSHHLSCTLHFLFLPATRPLSTTHKATQWPICRSG
ncbi:hypothetical protein BD310DRAFT_601694 [Dichomitus squalens]|uniref:Uncharacterized protein n=1 Tax=Dichomitus squalens TaxID=114155 RepID=A0A4Q9PQT5_9APHY|nr:hypothetical protein BD310DRAFT_601694 [Dichomitus squalens]